jgi:peptidoglycan/xylan/chitin deacetylase (PgdA/CDA1 family)
MGAAVAYDLRALETYGTPWFKMNMRAITLLYHDVVPSGGWALSGFQGADADVYKLECGEFRRHLLAIRQSLHYEPTTGAELLARPLDLNRGDRPVLLTFDDGGVSGLLYVADILDEFGWKAHFLVTAGRIGTDGFLDRSQIQALRRRGHVIGSHSYTHPIRMAHCSAAELDDEWRRSVLSLADILGEPIQVASVPGGYYSRGVALAAARSGIKLLFNSEPVTRSQTVDDCLVLGRFTAKRGYQPRWSAAIVAGARQFYIREYLFWNAKKGAKVILGGAWLRARVMLLERTASKSRLGPS